jgi:hypothetical protein
VKHALQADEVIKNLFKFLCGILHMSLKQRQKNTLKNEALSKTLDTISLELEDNDLILLNQFATIKSVVNRKAFSLTNTQMQMIHKKFINMFN